MACSLNNIKIIKSMSLIEISGEVSLKAFSIQKG